MTDKRYPPSKKVMIKKCTLALCGSSNVILFDLVNQELLTYLNQPGLSAQKLIDDFSDTAGSFYEGGSDKLTGASDGEFLSWKFAPGWHNTETAELLVNSAPTTFTDIMSVPKIGPDHYYDMFRVTLLRMITQNGVCLPIINWWDRGLMDGAYFRVTSQVSGDRYHVKVLHNIAFDLTANTPFFVFPHVGRYTLTIITPRDNFYDPNESYSPADLIDTPFTTTVDVDGSVKILPVNIECSRLSLEIRSAFGFDGHEARVAIVRQQNDYSTGKFIHDLYNRSGVLCTDSGGTAGCKKFAAQHQEDFEVAPSRSVTLKDGIHYGMINFYGLPDDTYKALYYSDVGALIGISSATNLELGPTQIWCRAKLGHTLGIDKINDTLGDQTMTLPSKAFISGDIIRQFQQDTNDCGTFSLALAASYWDPFKYNVLKRNGRWFSQHHGDWKPGTWQGHMCEKAGKFGFYSAARVLDRDNTTRTEGIKTLKRWIASGVPVIVNIDEYQDTETFSGEHYKVLVGYDDDAQLGYYKEDGTEVHTHGALYFANSGAKGKDEPDDTALNSPAGEIVDDIANSRRENHESFLDAPIGNDVDSYRAFFYKWKHGGVAPFTDDLWYLPFFPYHYKCYKCDSNHRVTSKIGKSHWHRMKELAEKD